MNKFIFAKNQRRFAHEQIFFFDLWNTHTYSVRLEIPDKRAKERIQLYLQRGWIFIFQTLLHFVRYCHPNINCILKNWYVRYAYRNKSNLIESTLRLISLSFYNFLIAKDMLIACESKIHNGRDNNSYSIWSTEIQRETFFLKFRFVMLLLHWRTYLAARTQCVQSNHCN